MKKNKGFTLIEVLCSICILLLVAGVCQILIFRIHQLKIQTQIYDEMITGCERVMEELKNTNKDSYKSDPLNSNYQIYVKSIPYEKDIDTIIVKMKAQKSLCTYELADYRFKKSIWHKEKIYKELPLNIDKDENFMEGID